MYAAIFHLRGFDKPIFPTIIYNGQNAMSNAYLRIFSIFFEYYDVKIFLTVFRSGFYRRHRDLSSRTLLAEAGNLMMQTLSAVVF